MRIETGGFMREDYINYYVLSYFNTKKVTRVSQIYHVFKGKRTPSMFYLAEINHWHHGFLIDKRIERKELNEIINCLLQEKFLITEEKGYVLTPTGKVELETYFEKHYLPNRIQNFSNLGVRKPFWDRLQLFTQVFSEYSHKNSKYIPIIKDPIHQENVRQLFRASSGNLELFFKQWLKEQKYLFQRLEEPKANVLGNSLTGHGWIGKTGPQLAKSLKMQEVEFSFYLRDLIEELIEDIKDKKARVPLTYKILKQTHEENYLGLSESTYQSYQLLQQGANIQQIASKRYIKENTVKEHILEMAFILDKFPIQQFMPKLIYEYLNVGFANQKEYNFRQAVAENEALEFYQYRLVELERMRSK